MQTIRTSTTNKKQVAAIVLAVVLVLIGAIAVAAVQNIGPFADSSRDETTAPTSDTSDDDVNQDEEPTPDETEEPKEGERSPNAEGGDKPTVDSGNPPEQSSSFDVSVDSIVDGNEVRFTSLIQKVSNTGRCRLTITNGTKTIERTATVTRFGSQQSTCRGFTIEKSELTSGSWRASLRVAIGSQISSASTAFEI